MSSRRVEPLGEVRPWWAWSIPSRRGLIVFSLPSVRSRAESCETGGGWSSRRLRSVRAVPPSPFLLLLVSLSAELWPGPGEVRVAVPCFRPVFGLLCCSLSLPCCGEDRGGPVLPCRVFGHFSFFHFGEHLKLVPLVAWITWWSFFSDGSVQRQ